MSKWRKTRERLDTIGRVLKNILHVLEVIRVDVEAVLHASQREPKAARESAFLVVWGSWLPYEKDGAPHDTCFSLSVNSEQTRFAPDMQFQLKRWLLIGGHSNLRVTDILIGAWSSIPSTVCIAGIVGRHGEGDYPLAQIGTFVTFRLNEAPR